MPQMALNDTGLTLVAGKTSIPIEPRWIPRWGFLSDLVEDMSGSATSIEWTRTDVWSLLEWKHLNAMMDTLTELHKKANFRPLSGNLIRFVSLEGVWEVIDFMRPVNGEYLLFTTIDEDLSAERRRGAYESLGRYIRGSGIRPVYAESSVIHAHMKIHENCLLFRDPVYNDLVRTDEELMSEALSNEDINIVTGILHIANRDVRGPIDFGLRVTEEIPWNLIRWNDVVEMTRPFELSNLQTAPILSSRTPEDKKREMLAKMNDVYDNPGAIRQGNLHHLLAGSAPPETEHFGFPVTALSLTESLSLVVPAPDELVSRLISWYQAGEGAQIAKWIISVGTPQDIPMMNNKTAIGRLLPEIVVRMAWGTGVERRPIDSLEYPELSRKVYEGLGTNVLLIIATEALKRIQGDLSSVSRLAKAKLERLAEAALEVIESTEPKEFISMQEARTAMNESE